MTRVAYLDGWRGAAILTVLAGHYLPLPQPTGAYGVELFFVLSGRLMAEILFVKEAKLSTFFQRRFSRVYPALAVFVSMMLFLRLAHEIVATVPRGTSIWSAMAALTFTTNYAFAFAGAQSPYVDHLWSLAVEEQSYLLLVIAALASRRVPLKPQVLCSALALLGMSNGLRLYLGSAGGVHEIYWRTDVRLAPIFLSASLYLIMKDLKHVPSWVPVASFAGATVGFFSPVPLPVSYIASACGLALAVNTLQFSPRPLATALSSKPLVFFGMTSFSLYLWQQPFYKAGEGFLGLLAGISCAIASYYVVEVPARRWINGRQWRRAHDQ